MGHIVVGGAFPFDGGNRQDVVADGSPLFKSAAFTQEKNCFHLNGREQIYDSCCVGASHTEIN